MKVNILGGAVVTSGGTLTINSGNSLTFQITNIETGNCSSVRVQSITTNNPNFSVLPTNANENIKPSDCNGTNFLNFTVTRGDAACTTENAIITIFSNEGYFTFTLTVNRAPIISVLGGSPLADVIDGAITTTATNGTYFGVVEQGLTKTRRFYIVNTGSCNLVLSSITSTNASIDPVPVSNFTITTPIDIYYPAPLSYFPVIPGGAFYFDVTFTAGDPANNEAIISITNNTAPDTNLFTFTVKAEVFDVTGPGPGGVTADFRLWLKATRGVRATASKVHLWKDLGSNGKDAMQDIEANQPTYKDDVTSNINFNPVIEFDNTGVEQYLYNSENGFYSQDIFIVMMPKTPVTTITPFSSTSSRNTIFAGVSKKAIDDISFDAGDVTGVGFGNYTTRFTNEVLTYGQNTDASFNSTAEISTSYANAGIINVRNDATVATKQELLYNSKFLSTSFINDIPFTNVGYIDEGLIWGTPYWIGKNYGMPGNLNGRVAEIMTFAQRVPDADRPKIETYLAIKYGITLGATQAEKNYVNSAGTIIWDIAVNAVFNYNIAGIGRADNSDLNQKQSKSVNDTNEVTIGLGLIAATNSANVNEFKKDGDFLVWGCDNGSYTGTSTNTVTIATGITTSLTRINRRWKIVESKEALDGDVENVFVGIPLAAFSGFAKTPDEEYVLIVSETENFTNADIVDVIPLKPAGLNLQTWYDFDGTKYFTFGKAPKLTEKSAVNIATGDYLVGEYALNLNINAFTISAWVRGVTPSADPRTIMAKGTKLQLRLNGTNNIEVMVDNDITPRFTSNMILNDGKWHNITFVYASGTVFLYIDGILDSSVQGVNPPTPNYNRFSIGAVYVSKDENDIKNPFLGEIDEVYVWDQGLSQDQVRYLMNQETEKVTGNLVNGKALPQASPSNEIANIPWNKLKAYYDFNTFYGTTVEGLTDDRNFLRIKYLDKTKTITGTQTAPLPYVSAADGVWGNAATWANSNVQNLPNALGLDGTTTVDWNIVETSHDISSGNRNITVLGLKNNSGKITIDGTLDLGTGTGTGHGLRVTHYLKLDGVINLAGESQLMQDEGSILDEKSGGYLDKDQQGTASSYNYNYWSSSVGPITAFGAATGVASPNLPFSVKGNMLDGDADNANAINFQPAYYAADLEVNTPPNLIVSGYWLYKFYGKDDDYNSWFPRINENSPLEPGEGYTMKGTSKLAAITSNQNYKFRGKPYNGTITLNLKRNDSKFAVPLVNVDRLIGNPYSSAIDANEFILDNIYGTINNEIGRNGVNIFNGALYFWHHFSGATHYLAEYVGGYATYTLMGGVEAYSTDSRINNSTPTVGGGKKPERYIPVNQGFFVITALPPGISGTTTTVEGGEILFKNSQRVFIKEGDAGIADGSLFFKGSKKTNAKQLRETRDEKAKIRLQFSSPKGYVRQLLVGLTENTTNHFDIGYDAPMADVNKDDMFWIFDGAKFVIQAVNNFNTDQELPLGIKIAKAGLATIKIDELENLDENISLHIKDKLTGETHNISQKAFEINLEAGQYLDRFVLIFKMQKLVAEDESAEVLIVKEQIIVEGIHVFMDNTIGELQIKNNSVEEILSVELYNYLGQRINNWNTNLNRRTISLPINTATGVYIVQINTKTGKTIKKISVE
ncbi:MAG: hypothetical protein A3F91_00730 [Flavobacteria bacterium RIFCSPLOWO2_12_FULL_35_11]|nr:MAG: hypothetical protein A3F91_00730 [Flavobacteria bacterium RIFCSPLOWO2_12_FULL_35_11]